MTAWITLTPRLQEGLEIISQLENAKCRSLVNRICQSLQSGINEKPFSSEEEDKLLASLNVKRNELDSLIDTVTFIYSRAAFGVVKPIIMESTMKETFSVSDEKVAIFVNAWMTHAKAIIDALRHKSIFPSQVEDIHWAFNVQAASSVTALEAKPIVLLQLGLNGREAKRLTVEMDKSNLTDFYNHLETIQNQLDALK